MSDCLHGSCKHGQRDDVQTQRQQSRKDREELVDDLADCLAQLQDDSDVEKIDRILEEIESSDPAAPDFDVEQSLARFYQKYGGLFSAEPSAGKAKRPKRCKPLRSIARTAAIIAAVLIVFIGAAQAAGFDLMRIFPWWDEERFHFAQEEENTSRMHDSLPEIEFESLQAALDNYDIQVPLAPAKLPDGAELQMLSVQDIEGQLIFRAEYILPSGKLFITIKQTTEVAFSEIEKDADNTEVYPVDGIEHLIMDDVERQKAVWYNGIWESSIDGNISREELTAMIDSIYR